MQANCLHHTNFAMSALVLGSEWLPSTLLPGSGWGSYTLTIYYVCTCIYVHVLVTQATTHPRGPHWASAGWGPLSL